MKPSSRYLPVLLSSFLLTHAEAVLVYWVDVDADTLTISGQTNGTVTDGGVEWYFETGDSGEGFEELSLVSGGFSTVLDVLAFLDGTVGEGFFLGSEEANGDLTVIANEAVYSYSGLPGGVETFIEGSMMGNDIPLFAGDGFGDIVYIPEPGTTMLLGIAMLGVIRRRR